MRSRNFYKKLMLKYSYFCHEVRKFIPLPAFNFERKKKTKFSSNFHTAILIRRLHGCLVENGLHLKEMKCDTRLCFPLSHSPFVTSFTRHCSLLTNQTHAGNYQKSMPSRYPVLVQCQSLVLPELLPMGFWKRF